jgi:hypothetical protein
VQANPDFKLDCQSIVSPEENPQVSKVVPVTRASASLANDSFRLLQAGG